MRTLAPSFLIVSSPFSLVTRTTKKFPMRFIFDQKGIFTMEFNTYMYNGDDVVASLALQV